MEKTVEKTILELESKTLARQRVMDERLTEHFTLGEMVRSGVAMECNIDNTPTIEAVDNLRLLCQNVLEPARKRFGAIRITSGYRSKALNQKVGGVHNSQHLTGEAADIHISSKEEGRKLFDWISRNTDFDQLIFEHPRHSTAIWLHVSHTSKRPNRHQAIA